MSITKPSTCEGIDVSRYQGAIDWNKVKADGIKYAFIRINGYTRGTINIDSRFEMNIEGAKAAGLKVGIYFYSEACSIEAAELEADTCLEYLNKRNLDLPIWYDIEHPPQSKLGKRALTDILLKFCDIITNAGYIPGIYSGKYWFRDYMYHKELVAKNIPLWIAQYNNTLTFEYPDDIYIWQYSSCGNINGISGNVDTNICLKSYTELLERCKKHNTEVNKWLKGQVPNNNKWWYRHSNGTYTTLNFETIDNKVYYFDENGWMVEGWKFINNEWYYFKPVDGYMVTNEWVKGATNNWYYMGSDGKMVRDTVMEIGLNKYSFAGDGHMEMTDESGALH